MEFRGLINAVYDGDDAAAETLYRTCGPLVLRVVRRHLHLSVRSQADSEDFVQDVWTAFVKDIPQNRTFESAEQLANFLGQVARNKVVDTLRRCFHSQKANINKEVRFETGGVALCDDHSTPSEAAIRKEVRDNILASLLPAHRAIGEMIFEGTTLDDIAKKTGLSLRTIERVRDRIAEKLR